LSLGSVRVGLRTFSRVAKPPVPCKIFWESWEDYPLNQKPPSPWTSYEKPPHYTMRVVNTRAHGGVQSLYGFSDGVGEYLAYAYRDLAETVVAGSVTLWLYVDNYTCPAGYMYYSIAMGQSGLLKLEVGLGGDGELLRLDPSGVWVSIGDYSLDTWFKLKIAFNCDTDTFSVSLNGVLLGSWSFFRAATAIDRIALTTGYSMAPSQVYCDDICFN